MSVPSFDQHYPGLGLAAPHPEPGGERAGADGGPAGAALAQAYAYCARLTRAHSKSFFFSTQLLPPAKRAAIRALYAFCRTSDDLVDLNPDDAAGRLADWRHTLHAPPRLDDPVPLAWADVVARHGISPTLEAELLAGMEMDLSLSRYDTFADLWVYCYRVASVVGLMSMQIIGHGPGAAPYAIKLGVALQLTNILRDVGEDAARGRIYLPREDLERFQVGEEELLAGRQSPRMQALLQFQIDRAHQLYELSWPGIALLNPDSRGAVATAACVYRGILGKIVENRYDVFSRRAHLTLAEKCWRLPAILWRARQLNRDSETQWSTQ